MTTSTLAAPLVGVQQPRVSSVPEFVSSAGVEAVEFCDSVGLHLDPWQQHVMHNALGERRDGRWSAFEVGLVVPRQNGKGSVLEARELAGLFLFEEELLLHSSHEFKTCAEGFLRVKAYVDNFDALRKRVRRIRTSHGEEGIELVNGHRLRFVARSTGSGRGFSGDVVVLDEAYNLGPKEMSALLPTLRAKPNPQVWYTSSAGMESSVQLLNVRERGLAGSSPRLAYFEWSAEEGCDPDDQQSWAQANPALGIRVSQEAMESERAAMDDASFQRECLGLWFDPNLNRVIPPHVWTGLTDPGSQLSDTVVFGLDATPDLRSASIAVAGLRGDGLQHLEVTDHHDGTEWVVPRVLQLNERWKPRAWVLDPASSAGAWIPDLQEAGIEPVLVSGRVMAQACGEFYKAAMESRFRHLGQQELTAALNGAKTRPLADAWAWHRRNSGVDISPLVAVTLALHGWATRGPTEGAPNLW